MPNAKHSLTLLFSNLESAFQNTSEEDKNSYHNELNGALDSATTIHSTIYGHPAQTILNSLRSSLQHVANVSSDVMVSNGAWNPITAAIFNTLEQIILNLDDDALSSQVRDLSLKQTPINGPKVSTKSGAIVRPSQKHLDLPVRSLHTVPRKPTVPILDKRCPPEVAERVQSALAKKDRPVFRNLPHVKCVKLGCTFCENLWMSLDLTKCSQIKCHLKGSSCNRDGWYAHVYPTTWLAAKKDHDSGLPFPGLDKYKPKTVDPSASTSASAVKRNTTYAEVALSPKRHITEREYLQQQQMEGTFDDDYLDEDSADAIWFNKEPNLDEGEVISDTMT